MTTILSQPSTVSVLIVGAGPTGLMLACQLSRFGIPFRIIEKREGTTTQSRALAIQSRTLEIFEQMGIAKQAVKQGKRAKAVNYVTRGKVTERISLEGYGETLTQYPYLLILDQSRTEQLLVEFLQQHGHAVEWQTELTSFTEDETGVSARLRRADGMEERVRADWLVGTDGAKSMVRTSLNIPFAGKTYEYALFVLDCTVDWSLKDDEGYIAFSDTSFAAFFPMTDGRCRVIGMLPDELIETRQITFEDVATTFADQMQMDVTLSNPRWISAYRSHHRYVSTFQKGRCFLAGDAAHIHSPVGAQGMNTGLQDAYNLAWKLSLVIVGKANPHLLETYTNERLPIAKSLVQTTDRVFSLTLNKNRLARFWIMSVAPRALSLILKIPPLARLAFNTISQIGIQYRKSILSQDASEGHFPRHAPRPGDRLPYVTFHEDGNKLSIQDCVREPALHLLLFQGSWSAPKTHDILELARRYQGIVVPKTVPLTTETQHLYEVMGISTGGYYLVRPDMYIAYRSTDGTATRLEAHLRKFFVSSEPTYQV